MSKHRVFIYGSCVSRDTFEHFDPDQFELVQYVARQSALSAYTRPVTLISPPSLESPFQQRMVSGDFASNLQALIPEAGSQIDLVLVDLTDERLGAYVLPDGSVITRSTELINSGAEGLLPAGSQHLPFGSDQHFQYWSQGIAAVGELIRQHMPHAAVVLLDIPWAERSDTGASTPSSFGISAAEANPVFQAYAQVAKQALRAETVTLRPDEVVSSDSHPWGDAPFHYAGPVYRRVVQQVTGNPPRDPWSDERSTGQRSGGHAMGRRAARASTPTENQGIATRGPNLFVTGAEHSGIEWLAQQLGRHPDVFVATGKGSGFFNNSSRLESAEEAEAYLDAYAPGQETRWRVDRSPTYFWHSSGSPFGPARPDSALEIKNRANADAPIIVVLREPVARAVAAYWHHFSQGRFDLSQSVFRVPGKLGIVDQGFYKRHYDHWSNILGSQRIHVFLYEDFVAQPRSAVESVLAILGLAPPNDDWLTQIKAPPDQNKPWLEPFQRREPIADQEIAALFEIYRRDVVAVEKIIGRRLTSWRSRAAIARSLPAQPRKVSK